MWAVSFILDEAEPATDGVYWLTDGTGAEGSDSCVKDDRYLFPTRQAALLAASKSKQHCYLTSVPKPKARPVEKSLGEIAHEAYRDSPPAGKVQWKDVPYPEAWERAALFVAMEVRKRDAK